MAAVTAAQQVLADAGHNLDALTVAAALAAADTAASEYPHTISPMEVQVTSRIGGYGRYAGMARETAVIFAVVAESYLRNAGAENYVEQHVTGRDGTRYVITFQRTDGCSPDELLAAAEATLDQLVAAILRLADQLDVRSHDTRILSVRGMLREVSASLRNLVLSDPG